MRISDEQKKRIINTLIRVMIVLIAAFLIGHFLRREEPADNAPQTTQTETQTAEGTSLGNADESDQKEEIYTFRNSYLRKEHFEKHGNEFDYDTAEEYESGASAVVNNPDALHKIEAEDGDDVYYLEKTNEFVIVSTDGYIRTYFKPRNGIKYYNKQ